MDKEVISLALQNWGRGRKHLVTVQLDEMDLNNLEGKVPNLRIIG